MATKTTKVPKKTKPPKKAQGEAQQKALDETYTAKGERDKSMDHSATVESPVSAARAAAPPAAPKKSPTDLLKELEDKYVRLRAEYDNFIKRTAREKFQLAAYGGESVVLAFLPILDDLQRSIDHARQAKDGGAGALLTGVEMVQEKFAKVLESEGVRRMDTVGQKFDPQLHDAMLRRPSQDHEEGTVLEEYERGYTYRNKVIRHAKVVVSG
ncbi:MAG: nucleotide exchange factor GrpE [Candidatus Marinimicrobia bacterium]|nr:nucleotide exchange factor GrpE [Candidatus Neomarinimicrobiota bacterium]